MGGSHTSLYYHVILSTRDRRPVLHPWLRSALGEQLDAVTRRHGGGPVAVAVTEDHVHLILSIRQDVPLAHLLRQLQGDSAAWLRDHYPSLGAFAWQRGYAAFTLHADLLPRAVRYLANQGEQHCRESFEAEYRRFLQNHQVEFDARLLWR
jgi:putative transposase